MAFKNEHIAQAFRLIASLSVSGDAVDVIWAARQQLLMADRQFEAPKKEEVKNDG